MIGDNYPFMKNEWEKDNKEYTPEETIKILTKAQMYYHLKKAIKRYGLEGTEEVVKRVYNTVPKLKEQMLNMLWEIWKGL